MNNDLISRQAAINALNNLDYTPADWAICGLTICKNAIRNLPSTQKTGKWKVIGKNICQCSICRDYVDDALYYGFNFCPNCGAEMENDDTE